MFKELNELELTEEQKTVFDEARKWAFGCEMGSGCDWEIKKNIVEYLNNNAKLDIEIIDYYPDFYKANDKIRIK